MDNATTKDRIVLAIAGTAWVAGLLIAGSENSCMPWVNMAGGALFFVSCLVLGKVFDRMSKRAPERPTPAGRPVRGVEPNESFGSGLALGVLLKS